MKTPDTHETLLALSAQIKNGIEKGVATPNGKIIESINKVSASYSQVSKALCNKENATLDEVLQAVSQVKAELEAVKRERDAAVNMLESLKTCDTCIHKVEAETTYISSDCFLCTNMSEHKFRGVCPENTEVQNDG